MSGHTKELLTARRLVDNHGTPYSTHYLAHIDLGVCMVWAPVGNEEQEANANRLVACWNACSGIPDPAALRAQRDELLAACEAALEVFGGDECWHDHHGTCQAHHMRRNANGDPECEVVLLRAAIANAKGGA